MGNAWHVNHTQHAVGNAGAPPSHTSRCRALGKACQIGVARWGAFSGRASGAKGGLPYNQGRVCAGETEHGGRSHSKKPELLLAREGCGGELGLGEGAVVWPLLSDSGSGQHSEEKRLSPCCLHLIAPAPPAWLPAWPQAAFLFLTLDRWLRKASRDTWGPEPADPGQEGANSASRPSKPHLHNHLTPCTLTTVSPPVHCSSAQMNASFPVTVNASV